MRDRFDSVPIPRLDLERLARRGEGLVIAVFELQDVGALDQEPGAPPRSVARTSHASAASKSRRRAVSPRGLAASRTEPDPSLLERTDTLRTAKP